MEELRAAASAAFAAQDFASADRALRQLSALQPDVLAWREGLAEVAVDDKRFEVALARYDEALQLVSQTAGDGAAEARLRSGRALAYEGLSRWTEALADYDAAISAAAAAGFATDPYITNSRGNVLASLGRWGEARGAYVASAAAFQGARGFRSGASTTARLDGAIYAGLNAALVLVEQGDDALAERELRSLSRRAPNSVDARAALAALAWRAGRPEEAEGWWSDACSKAESCGRYRDADYLARIRRWPPRAAALLAAFVELRRE